MIPKIMGNEINPSTVRSKPIAIASEESICRPSQGMKKRANAE
jgi:hypothetical protein